jgi:superfamily II DNA or RNA helicase
MDIIADGWVWFDKRLIGLKLQTLKNILTIQPRKVGDYPGEDPKPIYLYEEQENRIGIAREFYFGGGYRDILGKGDSWVCEGDSMCFDICPLKFKGVLRSEQAEALEEVLRKFKGGLLGGIVKAPPGWGKTTLVCAFIAALSVPTLVVVHKEFLLNQWKKRISQFLPDARVGHVQQDTCVYEDKHIVLGMVHSLSGRQYSDEFYKYFGMIITDECHRIGAATWSSVPPKFPARWRLGVSATPRRKDQAEDVFKYHIGSVVFTAKEKRLGAKVRRVWTPFKLVHTPSFNPSLARKTLLLRFLCGSTVRNTQITEQLVLAVQAGRKCLVVSERLKHLNVLETMFRDKWKFGENPTTDFYVGGRSEEALDQAAEAQVIFATVQLVSEALDIPSLDTLFLTTPLGDIEQIVGRILRPFEGKKDPIVVDFRDDEVGMFKNLGVSRDKYYKKEGW